VLLRRCKFSKLISMAEFIHSFIAEMSVAMNRHAQRNLSAVGSDQTALPETGIRPIPIWR
jgi:hypothetical protein